MSRRLLFPVVLSAVFAASCGHHTANVAPVASPAPAPSSPALAVQRLGWCWNNRDYETNRTVFTDDFRFAFAAGDSAGNPYAGSAWTREDELAAAYHLFIGDGTSPPAKSITLHLDRNLIALNDPRPRKQARWHKTIRTHIDLSIEVDHGDGATEVNWVQGFASFYLVRGDSATMPTDLTIGGWRPDSTQWFIERWQDETLPVGTGGGLRALPSKNTTWGSIKAHYR